MFIPEIQIGRHIFLFAGSRCRSRRQLAQSLLDGEGSSRTFLPAEEPARTRDISFHRVWLGGLKSCARVVRWASLWARVGVTQTGRVAPLVVSIIYPDGRTCPLYRRMRKRIPKNLRSPRIAESKGVRFGLPMLGRRNDIHRRLA